MSHERPPGTFKIANRRRAFELYDDAWTVISHKRVERILSSIRADIDQGGICRVRQILKDPRALYRLELERPDLAYERTTILDAETLEELLERLPESTVRESFRFA